jgi:hypothetical protein
MDDEELFDEQENPEENLEENLEDEDCVENRGRKDSSRKKSGQFGRKRGRKAEAYTPVKKKRGRPLKVIPEPSLEDKELSDAKRLEIERRHVKELSELQVSDHQIALYINRDVQYVADKFRYDADLHRLRGQIRLLKAQFDKAIVEGNCNMQIWLGKHYLGQRDDVRLTSVEPEIRALFSQVEKLSYDRDELLTKPYYDKEKKKGKSEISIDIVPKYKTTNDTADN